MIRNSREPDGASDQQRDGAIGGRARRKAARPPYRRRSTMDELRMIQGETRASESVSLRSRSSSSSLSTVDGLGGDDDGRVGREEEEEVELLLLGDDGAGKKGLDSTPSKAAVKAAVKGQEGENEEFDLHAFMNGRTMTPFQEKMNALTVVPSATFCLYHLLSGRWLTDDFVDAARDEMTETEGIFGGNGDGLARADEGLCVRTSLLPNLHAFPPLPIIAVAIGIVSHAPFSFLYHWTYAPVLPPGKPRIEHWSRRLDMAFIHFTSASLSYGTSGSANYFWACAMFNLDCIYRQFKPKVHPHRNQIRIRISLAAYTIPILVRGDFELFVKLWSIFAVCGYLFSKYPIGGWSHSAFHLVAALLPPLLMDAAAGLESSRSSMEVAARCAVLAGA